MNDVMGIDQYGKTYHGLGKYPRNALLSKLGYAKADKMYVDNKNGEAKHVGYIIHGLWITLYNVSSWEK